MSPIAQPGHSFASSCAFRAAKAVLEASAHPLQSFICSTRAEGESE